MKLLSAGFRPYLQLTPVTRDRAVLYIRVDETAQSLRILAVFWAGQDYETRMRARLTP